MCGICGIVRFDDRPVEAARLDASCEVMHHRGPSDRGTWCDPTRPVGLGAVRLAVLDPTMAGHQPMHRGDRHVLVFNGEIYNYRDLRRDLEAAGERFRTESDTEVVLAACARWGTAALSRFNGMWALAFFDRESRCGFLAIDRFGIKPLLYHAADGGLTFASEMKALRALEPGKLSLDQLAARHLLQFGFIAHPQSIYEQVRRLSPGHLIAFDSKGAQSPEAYYTPPVDVPCRPVGEYGAARGEIRQALQDAVVRRRVADVPIGAFLSGGLDSSIIVSHLVEAVDQPVKTFAVGHAGQASYDETRFAREVARRFGTDHQELILTDADVLAAVPRVLDHLGEPFGDSSIVPTSLVSAFAAEQVVVCLSGDAGDELFAGYWRYLGHLALAAYERWPQWLRRGMVEPVARSLGASKSSGLANRLRQFRKLLRGVDRNAFQRHVAWSRILAPEAESLFAAGGATELDEAVCRRIADVTAAMGEGEDLRRILAFDLQYSLPGDMLHKVDAGSMMHSLEVRVPFLDPAVVEAALAMPLSWKMAAGRRKRILLDAYRGRLPDAVLDRGKMGFEVPIGEYLRGPLRELFLDTVSADSLAAFPFVDPQAALGLYEDHCQRRGEHADLLFALLSLCWWDQRHGMS